MSRTVALQDCVDLFESGGAERVDRAAGVIRQVKVLGFHSQNGRDYLPEGVNESHYENRVVYADHPRPGHARSVRDAIGILEGIEKRPSGVYAKRFRLLNPAGEFEQRVMSAAESAPHIFGLSHNAKGREKVGPKGSVIEQVEAVHSVDLVDSPATVKGLYESVRRNRMSTVKALTEALRPTRPGYSRALQEVAEAGIVSPDMPMDEPLPMEAPPEESVDHEQAILDAAKAVLDDTALDSKQKLDKIKKLLGILDAPASSAPSESESEAEESIKAQLAGYKMRERVRNAADAAGVKVPGVLLESLKPSITDAQITNLVESLRGSAGGATMRERPRSAAPISGAGASKRIQEGKVPENADPKSLARWLEGKG